VGRVVMYSHHVVVVTHRPEPEGWDPEAPFSFVDGVEAALAKAQELAVDRAVEVAAGDVRGRVLAAGLIDEVRMDVVPVVFGSGKRYFGSVEAQHLLEDATRSFRATGCFTCAIRCAADPPELSCVFGAGPNERGGQFGNQGARETSEPGSLAGGTGL
jgi:dihydrofolate reductase